MTLTTKFKKDLQTLRAAANGDFYLDVKNPKLYKKVRKFYENQGIIFSDDPLDNYDILIDYLIQDLEIVEVWALLLYRKFFLRKKDIAL